MKDTCFCVHHAEVEKLVAATGVASGRSTCGAHDGGVPIRLERRQWRTAPKCAHCGATAHRSYFVGEDLPLCIRHAADAVFDDDDMGAHEMAHAAYIELNRMGVWDAY